MITCNDIPAIKLVKNGEMLVRVRTPKLIVLYGVRPKMSFYAITVEIMQTYPDFTKIEIIQASKPRHAARRSRRKR